MALGNRSEAHIAVAPREPFDLARHNAPLVLYREVL